MGFDMLLSRNTVSQQPKHLVSDSVSIVMSKDKDATNLSRTFKYLLATQFLSRGIPFIFNTWIVRHLTEEDYAKELRVLLIACLPSRRSLVVFGKPEPTHFIGAKSSLVLELSQVIFTWNGFFEITLDKGIVACHAIFIVICSPHLVLTKSVLYSVPIEVMEIWVWNTH
ncbi:unnamed protein product [Vicia faba]|uniref:Man(5)GlcNAc(2)-PP-dolichol translocation protein RFT1 n=1 Tax=Vicia faba TaxID=3906 RepID=A0AAV0ZZA1_VICFA|nr:unnamed protein product [Vicia faba]